MKVSFSVVIPLVTLILLSHSFSHYSNGNPLSQNNRETLEIIIGGGGILSPSYPPDCPECSPPSEPPCPPPPPPPLLPPSSPHPPRPPSRPPKPPSTPPSPLPIDLDPRVSNLLQAFSDRVTYDPMNITKTWTGKNVCKYRGFDCKNGRVIGFNINGAHLDGKNLRIGDILPILPDLTYFHINSNNLTGAVPTNVSKLSSLNELDFSNNKLGGKFPREVLTATKLTFLDLRFNGISGPIPPGIFKIDLDALFLNNNMFSGNLPKNLGDTRVLFLTFANNYFTGQIPDSIGQANFTLLEVLFLNNTLSGCLPYQIGNLNNLTVFDASANQLTGPIPHSFGCLGDMQLMNLSYNQFYGPVPEVVCKLGDLTKLTLNNNYFTQVGPECRKLIAKNKLNVKMNCILDLPQQKTAAECAAFFSKRRSCPDEASLTKIPCNIQMSAKSDRRPRRAMAPSPSYAALENHNN